MKKRTEKKAKAKATSKIEVPADVAGSSEAEAKPSSTGENSPPAKDRPAREVIEGVRAIVLKKGKIPISERQALYQTGIAYCIFDKDAGKRVAWILKKRVRELER